MLEKTVRRYLFCANGPEIEPIRQAFCLLTRISEESDNPIDAILLIPTRNSIREGTTLWDVLGSDVIRTLLRSSSVELPSGVNLRLETRRTFSRLWTTDVVIGVYITPDMLDQMDSILNVKALIVVPWIMEDIEEWRRTWNPLMPGCESAVNQEASIENPVVEECLKRLTLSVNLSAGLSQPDRSKTVELFRLLHASNEIFDPYAVKAWALHNGWTPNGANELENIAQAILDGQRVRGSHGFWLPNLVEEVKKDLGL